MNGTSWLYAIDGKPMLTPEAGVQMEFCDLGTRWRDEAGFLHHEVRRSKVGAWDFNYGTLTQADYSYMLSILPASGEFTFTYPDPADPACPKTTRAYMERYGISWYSARQGLYRNFKLRIIEC